MRDFVDVMIVFGVMFAVFTIYVISKAIDLVGKCWHSWGTWDTTETPDAYVQSRKCTKCGYVETEQFRKLKVTNVNN